MTKATEVAVLGVTDRQKRPAIGRSGMHQQKVFLEWFYEFYVSKHLPFFFVTVSLHYVLSSEKKGSHS